MKTFVRNVLQKPSQLGPWTVVLAGGVAVALLGALDSFLQAHWSFELFYLLVIVFIAWGGGTRIAAAASILCAGIMATHDWHLGPHSPVLPLVVLWNGLSRLIIFCSASWLVANLLSLTKRLKTSLEENTGKYEAVLATAMDGFASLDASNRFSDLNGPFCRMLGYTPNELLRAQLRRVELDESRQELEQRLARIRATGGDRFETQLRHKDGTAIDVEISVSELPGTKGGLVAFSREIGERKRAESLLKAQRDLALRLSSTSDLQTALNALLDIAVNLEGVDSGGVYLRDPQTGDLTLAAHRGPLSAEFLDRVAHYSASTDRAKLVRKGQPVYQAYADLPVALEAALEPLRAVAVLPLRHEDLVLGSLNLSSHTRDTIPAQSRIAMEVLAAQTTGAIARVRAEAERHRLEQQILEITDREQARIGQELHDGLCQQLVSLAFDANSLQAELKGSGDPRARVADRIATYLDKAISEARQLSRGLFPVRLEAEGLPSALEELASVTQERFGINCTVDCIEPLSLRTGAMAVHLYRIAQEAVANAVKHSRATTITIHLALAGDQVTLEVHDDGIGFVTGASANPAGMGLHIMDYRARSIGGSLLLQLAPNGGTTVSCCIPGQTPETLSA